MMKLIDIFLLHGTESRLRIAMSKIKKRILFFTAAIAFFVLASPGPGTLAFDKKRVTALYLYNILLFVDWPENAIDESEIICVAVIGDDHMFEFLKPLAGKTMRGRKVVVARFEEIKDLKRPCHALFIGRSKRISVPQILEQIKDEHALTVSDMEEFTQMGGMVLFRNIGDPSDKTGYPKRFEINLPAVKRAGLNMRSRLLRLSDIVYNP